RAQARTLPEVRPFLFALSVLRCWDYSGCHTGRRHFLKIPHPLREVRDDGRRRWRRQCGRMVALKIEVVILTSLARKDLPAVLPFWLALSEIESTSAAPWTGLSRARYGRSCHVVTEGRYLLLFCRVKREAENPFEIETARIHLSPRYPPPVPNGADCLVPVKRGSAVSAIR